MYGVICMLIFGCDFALETEKQKILFSVIIPVYNAVSFLEECIKSVLAQTCPDYELILVDDGSTDGSGELCDRFASKKVTVFHQNNQGHTATRQKGAESSRGRYLVFLDSDDMLEPAFLETVQRTLHETSADMVQCRMQTFFDPLKPSGFRIWDNPVPDGYYDEKGIQKVIYPCLMMDQNGRCFPRSLCAKAIRREIVLKHLKNVPSAIQTGEDMCGVISMFKDVHSLAVLSDADYLYRTVPGSISKSANPDALSYCAFTVKFLKQLVLIDETVLDPQYPRLCVQQAYSACLRVLRSKERNRIHAAYDLFLHQTGFLEILKQARFSDRKMTVKKELIKRKWFWAIWILDQLHEGKQDGRNNPYQRKTTVA